MRTTLALFALTGAVMAAGCGSSGSGASVGDPSPGVDPNDDRAVALDCLKKQQKLDARLLGPHAIQLGDPGSGPRIQFYLTNGQAEAAQFEGRAEGAEQIGKALLYVRKAPDPELKKIEACLDSIA
jgi:hypothetical protein